MAIEQVNFNNFRQTNFTKCEQAIVLNINGSSML